MRKTTGQFLDMLRTDARKIHHQEPESPDLAVVRPDWKALKDRLMDIQNRFSMKQIIPKLRNAERSSMTSNRVDCVTNGL